MNWSSEQQRLLGAMGYELLVRAGAAAAALPAPLPAPARTAIGAAGTAAPGADPGARAAAGPERYAALRQALLRAAGGHAGAADLIADCERLRREPAAKRALWPRLRALRRSH